MDDVTRLMKRFGWSRAEAKKRLGLVAQAEARLGCDHGLPPGCCAVCANAKIQKEARFLSQLTGRSVAELEAELTAPDPWGEAS